MWQSATRASCQSMAVSVVPMPSTAGSASAHLVQRGVGRGDRVGQRVKQVGARRLAIEPGERGDGHGAGHLTGGMPAHAIGDGEQARARVRRVLVAFPEEPDVGADRVAECKCHLRSSRTVLPMRIGTPTGTGVGWVTFWRSR